jgi:predicted O-linked N-acetylglucosamine transferase (SPINDLY family)
VAADDAAQASHPTRALFKRAAEELETNQPGEALARIDEAMRSAGESADALALRSLALLNTQRPHDAVASADRALALDPRHGIALANRAAALSRLKRYEEAAEATARLVAANSEFPYARGSLFGARMYCSDWTDYTEQVERLRTAVNDGRRACRPFVFLQVADDAAEQRRCAERFVADLCPPAAEPLGASARYGHDRIRVAYLSTDLHNHATAYLMAELLERHDRQRFEITAFSYGPAIEDAMRTRLRAAVEHFLDVRELSDHAVAALLRERETDIVIDLKGYTQSSRPRILAARPAPVQVGFLGYPGTSGAPYVDYLVADREVVPPEQAHHYSERIVYLPDCYQPNDSRRPIALATPSRAELGLPEDAFVFCCFNNSYKITPPVFACWMTLLRETPNAVLWLLPANAAAARNLAESARRHGIDPRRLRFAEPLPLAEHLARQRRADLFVDTLPYNAHTTASDALWAGLPVLTCRGESFAARVAASLLRAVGLPELVTDSLDAYTERALRLARAPDELAALRARLEGNRLMSPLFDAARYTRHFEAALQAMHSRHERGLPPESFRQPVIAP